MIWNTYFYSVEVGGAGAVDIRHQLEYPSLHKQSANMPSAALQVEAVELQPPEGVEYVQLLTSREFFEASSFLMSTILNDLLEVVPFLY